METLPKTLPGAVCAQWVRCCRPNCRCARGHLHGPYFYRFWREGARRHAVAAFVVLGVLLVAAARAAFR